MLGIVVLLLLAIQCPHHLVDSFHEGAPDLEQACLHLNPSGHPGSTETTPCPYTVTLDSEYYEPGETYQGESQQTTNVVPMVLQYWSSVEDGGSILKYFSVVRAEFYPLQR